MMWHLLQLELAVAVSLTQPVLLGEAPTIVPMLTRESSEIRSRVLQAASSPTQNVLLVLKGIEAELPPHASWEVHVEPAGSRSGGRGSSLVGVISLFGQEPSEVVFAIDKAIDASAAKGLQIRFVPISGVVVNGVPQAATVRSTVTIGEISLALETF